jgi:hypothetical protein
VSPNSAYSGESFGRLVTRGAAGAARYFEEVHVPKKNKKARKPQSRPSATGRPGGATPAGWTPEALAGVQQFGMSRALSRVDEEAWERLRSEFLAKQPICPDCGADWDLDTANEEEGVTFSGQEVISISAVCSKYDEDDFAGREPAPHPISDGMGEHELQLT